MELPTKGNKGCFLVSETLNSFDPNPQTSTKFCKHCGGRINSLAVVCTLCGLQVEELKSAVPMQQPHIVINNSNVNTNNNTLANGGYLGRPKNKWIALLLCLFVGAIGGHKFYEGKILMGILYFFTAGFLFVGVVIDFIALLFKSDPYYV
jgi:hypothetical protein